MDYHPLPLDPFDPERLALPPELVGDGASPARAPRHAPGETFLRGPIPWSWWAGACQLPGQAVHVASAVRYLAGWSRGRPVPIGLATVERSLGVRPDAAGRGLRALESAGLVGVERGPGRKPVVRILDGPQLPDAGPDRRRLRGPIPWAWWVRACRLPGRSLVVASALWALVGWARGRESVFELGLSDWPELGLTRFSAGRGLRELELAGLVGVLDRPGRKPIVTVLDGRRGPAETADAPESIRPPERPPGRARRPADDRPHIPLPGQMSFLPEAS